MLLSRLARFVEAGQHLPIRPQRLAVTFVTSDIGTFLIQVSGVLPSLHRLTRSQAIGGSVSVSANDKKKNQLGSRVGNNAWL